MPMPAQRKPFQDDPAQPQALRAEEFRRLREQEDFLGAAAHALRNPLNAITMALHVLETRNTQPELGHCIALIQRNVQVQARILTDILDVSRIRSGSLALAREQVFPGQLASSCVQAMDAQAAQAQVRVELEVDAAADLPMWLDAARLQQVCRNLLANALKFSPAGTLVRMRMLRPPGALELVVQDQGAGLDAAALAALSYRPVQGPAAAHPARGGLDFGLLIARHLVELHGGTLMLHSAGPGQGTTARALFPDMPAPQAVQA